MGDSESRTEEGNTENEPEDFIQGIYIHTYTQIYEYMFIYI